MKTLILSMIALCAADLAFAQNAAPAPVAAPAVQKTDQATKAAEADAAFKRFFTTPFERKAMSILYSVTPGFHGKGWLQGNSEMHFRKGVEEGYIGFKADMRLSSDGEIILCHDEGFTFDENGRITRFDKKNYQAIHDMPLEKILKLEYAVRFEKQYLHPCKLDTMLAICEEEGKVAYLTLRPENWREDVAKRMAELVRTHNMQGRTIINLFQGEVAARASKNFVNKYLPGLVFCHTQRGTVALTKELIDASAEDGYQIICLFIKQLDSVTPELQQYAAGKGIRIWIWGVGKPEQTAECLAKGVSGFQMGSRELNNAAIEKLMK